ncbi:11175_t:CDS:2 [Dentiscutata erythropus]|uniref:11175_t:CDS:1 n=1 Tax=Dentiscutata erythropus TaxID=1348616 RepID=A0A9N9NVK9_9GLOM|nr:11175_t:CDS:2 [Dentiscutata erythropus]
MTFGQDNIDESVESNTLMTTSSASSHTNIELGTVVSENSQNNTNNKSDTLTTAFSHADIVNDHQNARNLENDEQCTVISENSQNNTNENTLESDILTTASNALHSDIVQKNTSTLVKNKSKKRNSISILPHNTNIKVNDH